MKKIALIGAPGVGKSTMVAGLFYEMKKSNKNVEVVTELVKLKVFKGDSFSQDGFDIQNTLEQKTFEKIFTDSDMDYLLLEGPLCNGYFYSSFYGKELESPVLKKIAKDNINNYDVIIFIKHTHGSNYVEFGRKEDLETSLKLEKHIISCLSELNYKNEIIEIEKQQDLTSLIQKIS